MVNFLYFEKFVHILLKFALMGLRAMPIARKPREGCRRMQGSQPRTMAMRGAPATGMAHVGAYSAAHMQERGRHGRGIL